MPCTNIYIFFFFFTRRTRPKSRDSRTTWIYSARIKQKLQHSRISVMNRETYAPTSSPYAPCVHTLFVRIVNNKANKSIRMSACTVHSRLARHCDTSFPLLWDLRTSSNLHIFLLFYSVSPSQEFRNHRALAMTLGHQWMIIKCRFLLLFLFAMNTRCEQMNSVKIWSYSFYLIKY